MDTVSETVTTAITVVSAAATWWPGVATVGTTCVVLLLGSVYRRTTALTRSHNPDLITDVKGRGRLVAPVVICGAGLGAGAAAVYIQYAGGAHSEQTLGAMYGAVAKQARDILLRASSPADGSPRLQAVWPPT